MSPKILPNALLATFLLCSICLAPNAFGQLSVAEKEDVGFTSLGARLGDSTPTGSGISVSQVEARTNPPAEGEAAAPAIYRPDASQFSGKQFFYESGGATDASSHATTVGRYFYGSSSLSPDIGMSPERIGVYDANGFLNSDVLHTFDTSVLPEVETNDIQNHSWVGEFGASEANIDAMRRMDYSIQRDDFVATYGLNNGSGTSVPSLMAGAYNGITVGRSDGQHSRGGITLDGGIRTRPDIVVPTSLTSWAAPTVGSAASLLVETARSTSALANADSSIVVKSLLMTGATRDEAEFGGNWTHTDTSPLDAIYGAGELNIDRSHGILESGEYPAEAAQVAGSTGWDLGQSSATVPQLYFFDLDPESVDFQIAATLVWNRDIVVSDEQPGLGTDYSFTPSLANLNLKLYSAEGFMIGSQLAESSSSVDNVELIAASGLGSGRYVWEVSSDTDLTEYGFSWLVEGATPVPEPSVLSLFCLIGLSLLRRRR